jgi:hypothetical protein
LKRFDLVLFLKDLLSLKFLHHYLVVLFLQADLIELLNFVCQLCQVFSFLLELCFFLCKLGVALFLDLPLIFLIEFYLLRLGRF